MKPNTQTPTIPTLLKVASLTDALAQFCVMNIRPIGGGLVEINISVLSSW